MLSDESCNVSLHSDPLRQVRYLTFYELGVAKRASMSDIHDERIPLPAMNGLIG